MNSYIENTEINLTGVKVKEIVLANFKTAKLLEQLGIDYCCRGHRLLEEVLLEKNITPEVFQEELKRVWGSKTDSDINFGEIELFELTKYIVSTHHQYVKEAIPQIESHLAKVVSKHSANHPELIKIKELFTSISQELLMHMMKEERVLFPLIEKLCELKKSGGGSNSIGNFSVQNPIKQMEAEHTSAGDMLSEIRNLSNNYMFPDDACMTYQTTYRELNDFEKDLFKHIHLENNILFPRAIELENELTNN